MNVTLRVTRLTRSCEFVINVATQCFLVTNYKITLKILDTQERRKFMNLSLVGHFKMFIDPNSKS